MSMQCEVIRDLLPLYQDGVCSEQSVQLVEEHLTECPACAQMLETIRTEVSVHRAATPEDISASVAMRALLLRWRRSKLLLTITCVVVAVALTLIGDAAYNALFRQDTVPIPASQVEVAYIYRELNTGDLNFRLRIKDGKAPLGSSWQGFSNVLFGIDSDTDDMYTTTLRPRIVLGNNPSALSGETSTSGYKDSDTLMRLYYGTPEENFVLWEPGMDIPTLTDEEARERFPDKPQ